MKNPRREARGSGRARSVGCDLAVVTVGRADVYFPSLLLQHLAQLALGEDPGAKFEMFAFQTLDPIADPAHPETPWEQRALIDSLVEAGRRNGTTKVVIAATKLAQAEKILNAAHHGFVRRGLRGGVRLAAVQLPEVVRPRKLPLVVVGSDWRFHCHSLRDLVAAAFGFSSFHVVTVAGGAESLGSDSPRSRLVVNQIKAALDDGAIEPEVVLLAHNDDRGARARLEKDLRKAQSFLRYSKVEVGGTPNWCNLGTLSTFKAGVITMEGDRPTAISRLERA